MLKICPTCDTPLYNDDDVVAIVLTKFVQIDSAVSYAISEPTKCIEVIHSECFDWEDYDGDYEEEFDGD